MVGVGILVSFWDGPFSGAMLVPGRVYIYIYPVSHSEFLIECLPPILFCFSSSILENFGIFYPGVCLTRPTEIAWVHPDKSV